MEKTVALFNSCSCSELQGTNKKIRSEQGFTPFLSLPHRTYIFHDLIKFQGENETKRILYYVQIFTVVSVIWFQHSKMQMVEKESRPCRCENNPRSVDFYLILTQPWGTPHSLLVSQSQLPQWHFLFYFKGFQTTFSESAGNWQSFQQSQYTEARNSVVNGLTPTALSEQSKSAMSACCDLLRCAKT